MQEILLELSVLGGESFPASLHSCDASLVFVVPGRKLIVLTLILRLIHLLCIGADVALHKLRDYLQVCAQFGLLLFSPDLSQRSRMVSSQIRRPA